MNYFNKVIVLYYISDYIDHYFGLKRIFPLLLTVISSGTFIAKTYESLLHG